MGETQSSEHQVTLARCRDPGFTPGVRDVAGLLRLWERCDAKGDAKQVVTALARGDRGVARALREGWHDASGPQRAVRLRVLSRIGQRMPVPELLELLAGALRDDEPRVVREAARALGKLDEAVARPHEAALLTVATEAALPERRVAVEALGRIGGSRAADRLRELATDDRDLARRLAEAITLITRRADRARAGSIRLDRRLPRSTRLRLRCRSGAAAVVAEQAAERLSGSASAVERLGRDAVELSWSGALDEVYRVRSAVEVALVFPLPRGSTLVDRIVAGLQRPELVEALQAWTEGGPRFRLAFSGGGRRRAAVWQVARRLADSASPLTNDSREITWTVEVDERREQLLCLPRGADPRFGYRRFDVPAATHPTLAALMAWAGRPRAGEVVWDPFCGSGSELVEAAMLAPGLHLRGTDVSAEALEAARHNLAAASIDAASLELLEASAETVDPRHGDRPVSLILSNPPMGRRVVVGDRGMRELLHDFVAHAARVLAPGGRMVWLSPAPEATGSWGRAAGLVVEDLDAIDMGGFFATPQVLRKPR